MRVALRFGSSFFRSVDPFTRKEWFHIKAPAPFRHRDQGWTPANRTEGQRLVTDNLKGRVFEVNLADLQKDETLFYAKVKLRCEEVQGQDAMTSFHGLDFTTDKKRSLVRKWQTLIEVRCRCHCRAVVCVFADDDCVAGAR